jgi:L-alanine-DL-glutamate epimerase-like enolase superfamily enzyme
VRHDQPGSDSTVRAVRVAAYDVPTDGPEGDGTLTWDSTTVVVVEVDAGDHTGVGWSYTAAAAASVVTDLLADEVVGRSALDPPAANEAMLRRLRNAGRPGIAACAVSAVDIALWDLKARLLDLPLVRLLGAYRDAVPVYGSGGFTTYDDRRMRAQLESWLDESGVQWVKIKIGESWGKRIDHDLERAAVARAVAGDRGLFVDANGGYCLGDAIRVGARLDELGVTWFEEPVSSDDLAGLAAVRAAVSADVTAGEYGYDVGYFARMLDAGAVDCLQIDVTRCGGVTAFVRAAAVADSHHIDVSGHCAPHLHAHVAAAVPNLRHVEYFHDHQRIEEQILFDGARPAREGVLRPGTEAGHGLRLKSIDAAAMRVA